MKRLFLATMALLTAACGQVNPTERAVFITWGEMDPKCYGEGMYTYNPISTDMDEFDVQVQTVSIDKLSAASFDIQEVIVSLGVNFAIDADNCHMLAKHNRNFMPILRNQAEEALKAATSQFTVEKLIQERPKVKDMLVHDLRDRMKPYYIIVQDAQIRDLAPRDEFMRSVEEKQIAAQRVLTAENLRLKAVKDAETAVATARGAAESNAILQKSLRESPEVLRFKELEVLKEKWDGKFPMFVGSGGIPLINLDSDRARR